MVSEVIGGIRRLRESVVGILRIRPVRPETVKKGKVRPAEFQAGLGGSGFCIVRDRYVVTAFHVLNQRKPRDPKDKFYAFVVPENGNQAFHFPVVGFALERPDLDIAVLELGPCAASGVSLAPTPVSFDNIPDGTRVLTLGFPAPEITGLNLDPQGNYLGGRVFLMSHANEGIVSAQYSVGSVPVYELNVAWHHGESGGPIATLESSPAAFSLMQQYRTIQSPHGIVAGPHRGCALYAVRAELKTLGALTR
jgi:hypothetical protein